MKKILGLVVAALLVMMMVGGGTWAYFSDTESSNSNTLAAGTIDLNIDGGNAVEVTFDAISNKAPNNSGNGNNMLANVGSLAAEMDVAFTAITNTESTDLGELNITYDAVGDGELGANTWIAVWLDYENAGGASTWGDDDIGLDSDQGTYNSTTYDTDSGTATANVVAPFTTIVDSTKSEIWTENLFKGLPVTVTDAGDNPKGTAVIVSNTTTTLTVATRFDTAVVATDKYSIASGPHYDLVNNYGSKTWNPAIASMKAKNIDGDNYKFNIDWAIPTTTGNIIQGDLLSFNILFTLEQVEAD